MQDPEKEKFILESIEKIKNIKKEIIEGKKNKAKLDEIMEMVQNEIATIQQKADQIFDHESINLTPEELEVYLQNPSNFSKDDWELLERIKSETADCKKEILKAGETDSAQELIKKGKKNKRSKGIPKKA